MTYAVRTAADWSSWSGHRRITYPSPPSGSPAPPTSRPETIDTQSAPTLTVARHALKWTAIAGVSTYVLVSKVAGQPEKFTSVSGTSVTPTAVPGATVYYSVRTAVDGSAWSSEVAISYPAPAPPPTPPPDRTDPSKESPAPTSGSFQFGINAGMEPTDGAAATKLGAKVVRIDFGISTTAAQMEPVIAGYAARGVRVAPLAGFYGGMPSPAEAQALASWARASGPGGTYWAAHGNGQLAIQTIEFGNETSGGYQYGDDNPGEPSYQARAETYAVRFKEAAEAISASGMKVGLLAVSEDWTGNWMNGMFFRRAEPRELRRWLGRVTPTGRDGRPRSRTSSARPPPTARRRRSRSTSPSGDCPPTTRAASMTTSEQHLHDLRAGRPKRFARPSAKSARCSAAERVCSCSTRNRDQALPGTSDDREYYMGALGPELQLKGAYTEAVEELFAG